MSVIESIAGASAALAKYIPFMAVTAPGVTKFDKSALITAIATAMITAASTVFATVTALGVKVDTIATAQLTTTIELAKLKDSVTELKIDRAERIGRTEADLAVIKSNIARLQNGRR